MQITSWIILGIIIIIMIYIFSDITHNLDQYQPVKTDEELSYYLRNYEDFVNITSYKDSLTYLFMHMETIVIYFYSSEERIVIHRYISDYYLNNVKIPEEQITTDKLWKFISNELKDIPIDSYDIQIFYASSDLNPATIYLESHI